MKLCTTSRYRQRAPHKTAASAVSCPAAGECLKNASLRLQALMFAPGSCSVREHDGAHDVSCSTHKCRDVRRLQCHRLLQFDQLRPTSWFCMPSPHPVLQEAPIRRASQHVHVKAEECHNERGNMRLLSKLTPSLTRSQPVKETSSHMVFLSRGTVVCNEVSPAECVDARLKQLQAAASLGRSGAG